MDKSDKLWEPHWPLVTLFKWFFFHYSCESETGWCSQQRSIWQLVSFPLAWKPHLKSSNDTFCLLLLDGSFFVLTDLKIDPPEGFVLFKLVAANFLLGLKAIGFLNRGLFFGQTMLMLNVLHCEQWWCCFSGLVSLYHLKLLFIVFQVSSSIIGLTF